MNWRGLIFLAMASVVGSAAAQSPAPPKTAIATFAGGCFWCVEADFDKVQGVLSTRSGYTGGKTANPNHQNYYRKNPVRYQYCRTGCGRDARLKQLWGDAAAH